MAERHVIAGRLGGLATAGRYGKSYMASIGRQGGRPNWQESLNKAVSRQDMARKRARLNRKEVPGRTPAVLSSS